MRQTRRTSCSARASLARTAARGTLRRRPADVPWRTSPRPRRARPPYARPNRRWRPNRPPTYQFTPVRAYLRGEYTACESAGRVSGRIALARV
ncbi:hypothetical protein HMPREF0972_00743 [Actinomyces sp. oral taxon 848 str. F0332]|nr:hypothetical protein HMPREF0972_00743 [Actinomyces sp. oral taxon 848 str. F0332]